jgi:hypothetical protein
VAQLLEQLVFELLRERDVLAALRLLPGAGHERISAGALVEHAAELLAAHRAAAK